MPQDTAYATHHEERTHWGTGAEWPRTRQTQHNMPSLNTGEQESSGSEHRTRKTTHRASRAVNRSQVAQDTAHATQLTELAHW